MKINFQNTFSKNTFLKLLPQKIHFQNTILKFLPQKDTFEIAP